MTAFSIALLQIAAAGPDIEANARIGAAACRRAKEIGADLALFPEMFSNGYSYAGRTLQSPNVWRAPGRWETGDEEARDNLVVRMGEGESIELATFDIDALRDYRRRETLGGAFRRPSAYGPLVGTEVCEPFLRVGPTGDPWREGRVLGERPG